MFGMHTIGAFTYSAFSRLKWVFVAKFAKLLKSTTEKRNPKKHLSLSVAICDRKHANRIPRPKAGVSLLFYANVRVTAKRLDYYFGITNRERPFGSNRGGGELKLGEDNSVPIKIHPELDCAFSLRP